jgi:endonuclease YncB( thermonuclease family)
MRAAVLTFALLTLCTAAQAEDLTGPPRIIDGDTLAIGSTRIRLEGIDAPETDQVCLNGSGVRWIRTFIELPNKKKTADFGGLSEFI